MAIFYAPFGATVRDIDVIGHPMAWVLRVQWVKFMLCSGAVKVFSQGPTWRELTALEFHFASTCLPTAEAWLFHSLPPALLRAGVAFMFVCELIAPWLLLLPVTPVRRVGVLVQVAFQALIQLSGNYNWFNLHTCVLLLPAWAADAPSQPSGRPPRGLVARLLAPAVAWEQLWGTRLGGTLGAVSALGALGVAGARLFPVAVEWSAVPAGAGPLETLTALLATPQAVRIGNHATEAFVREMLDSALQSQCTGLYLYTVTVLSALGYSLGGGGGPSSGADAALCVDARTRGAGREEEEKERSPLIPSSCPEGEGRGGGEEGRVGGGAGWRGALGSVGAVAGSVGRACLGAASLLLLGVTLLPLSSIASQPVEALVPSVAGLRRATLAMHARLRPFHATSSYGLFRRMTGVGPRRSEGVPEAWGWGGLPPSIVEVPAVAIEGHPSLRGGGGAAEEGWIEIPFRYAPFGERRAPRRTAPHQPRLDWQMWFAALGSYQRNPWLLHLAYKILSGGDGSATLTLLDTAAYPFPPDRPPARVRAVLYHIDFTRVPSPWANRIPGVALQPAQCGWAGPYAALNASSRCGRWWRRRRVREYFPPLDRGSLEELLIKPRGWPIFADAAARQLDPCRDRAGDAGGSDRALPGPVCDATVLARRAAAPLRRWVGWELGGLVFLDAPLLVIAAAAALALALGAAARSCGGGCGGRRRGQAASGVML